MVIFKVLVVQKMDKAIFWINLYPMQLGSLIYMYTLDSDFFSVDCAIHCLKTKARSVKYYIVNSVSYLLCQNLFVRLTECNQV